MSSDEVAVSATGSPGALSPTHYDLALDVDYEAEILRGVAGIEVENRNAFPVSCLSLLLYRLLRVTAVSDGQGQGLDFEQAVVSVQGLGKLQLNRISVRLPQPLASQGRTVVEVRYEGHLLGYTETGMSYVHDRIDRQFTIVRNDAWAFPIPGHPTIHSMFGSPRHAGYSYAARVSVPAGLIVANGGRLECVEERDHGVVYHYSSTAPSNRMDFAIAQYQRTALAPFSAFHFPEHREVIGEVLLAGRRAIDLLCGWFGPLASERTITLIEIPEGWGSQADVCTILQTAGAFADPSRRCELYHELCHLWDPPPTDQPSPRWNEGLASFLQFLIAEKLDGQPALDRAATRRLDRLRRGLPANPRGRQVPLVDYGRAGITELSYVVGALFFDLLYRLVGEAAFIRAIARFDSEFRTTGGGTEDLVSILRSTVEIDLGPLLEDWLYTPEWTTRIAQHEQVEGLHAYYAGAGPRT